MKEMKFCFLLVVLVTVVRSDPDCSNCFNEDLTSIQTDLKGLRYAVEVIEDEVRDIAQGYQEIAQKFVKTRNQTLLKLLERNVNYRVKSLGKWSNFIDSVPVPCTGNSTLNDCCDCLNPYYYINFITETFETIRVLLNSTNSACGSCSESIRQEFESNKSKILNAASFSYHWPIFYLGSIEDMTSLNSTLNRFSEMLKVPYWEIGENLVDARTDDEICFQCFIVNSTNNNNYITNIQYFFKEMEKFEKDPSEFRKQKFLIFDCFNRSKDVFSSSVSRKLKNLLQLRSSKPYKWNKVDYVAVARSYFRSSESENLKNLQSNPLSPKEHERFKNHYRKWSDHSSVFFDNPCLTDYLSKQLGKNVSIMNSSAFQTVLRHDKKYVENCKICSEPTISKFKAMQRETEEALVITTENSVYELMSHLKTRTSLFLNTDDVTEFVYKKIQTDWQNKSSVGYQILQRNYIDDHTLLAYQSDQKIFSPFLVPFEKGTNESDCWDCLIKNRFLDHQNYEKNLQIVRNILETANRSWKNCSSSLIADYEKKTVRLHNKINEKIAPDSSQFISDAMVDIYTAKFNELLKTFQLFDSNDDKVEEILVDNRTNEEMCFHNFVFDRKIMNSNVNSFNAHRKKIRDLNYFLNHLGECGNCSDNDRAKMKMSKTDIITAVNKTHELKKDKPFNWNGIDYFAVAKRYNLYKNDSDLRILRANLILYDDYRSLQTTLVTLFLPYNDFCWQCVVGEILDGYNFRDATNAINTVLNNAFVV